MSNIYIDLPATTANTDVNKSEITFKSDPTITFVLTGINEEANQALTLDINWGDGSEVNFNQKDLVFNYKKESIFNEMLYGKLGGTILDTYEHTFTPSISSFTTSLTAQFLIKNVRSYWLNSWI